ncbi:hypothetical protein Q1695_011688 [Nippostrongylus brasiliensis]|nr:hypothetical protein Q1695_011688 [Nippostrongylus brasiliensis]
MMQNAVLLLQFLIHLATAEQENTGVPMQCAEYLRCRSDELEKRWRCGDEQLKVIGDVCRLEHHLSSTKTLLKRNDDDITSCITKKTLSTIQSSPDYKERCIFASSTALEMSCAELLTGSQSRCELLRNCCDETTACEATQRHTTVATMLAIQRTTIEILLHGCRSEMNSVMAADVNRSDHEMAAKVLETMSVALNLIGVVDDDSDEDQSAIDETIEPTLIPAEPSPANNSANNTSKSATLSNAISSMLKAEEAHKSRSLGDPIAYRRRAELMRLYPKKRSPLGRKRFELPRRSSPSNRVSGSIHSIDGDANKALPKVMPSEDPQPNSSERTLSALPETQSLTPTLAPASQDAAVILPRPQTQSPFEKLFHSGTSARNSKSIPAQHSAELIIDRSEFPRAAVKLPKLNGRSSPVHSADVVVDRSRLPYRRKLQLPLPDDEVPPLPPPDPTPDVNVDVLIDRSEQLIPLRHRYPSLIPLPMEPLTSSTISNLRQPLQKDIAPPRPKTTSPPPTLSELPVGDGFKPLQVFTKSSGSTKGMYKKRFENRPMIRRPWSTKSKKLLNGRSWKGTSRPRPKYLYLDRTVGLRQRGVMRPWSMKKSPIRPSSSFRDQSIQFPNNTEMVTDIAVPIQNRMRSRHRGMAKELTVSPQVTSKPSTNAPLRIFTNRKRVEEKSKFRKRPEDAIYEDILNSIQGRLPMRRGSRRLGQTLQEIYEDVLHSERGALGAKHGHVDKHFDDFEDITDPQEHNGRPFTSTSGPAGFLRRQGRGHIASTVVYGGTVTEQPRQRGMNRPTMRKLITGAIRPTVATTRPASPTTLATVPTTTVDNPLEGLITMEPMKSSEPVEADFHSFSSSMSFAALQPPPSRAVHQPEFSISMKRREPSVKTLIESTVHLRPTSTATITTTTTASPLEAAPSDEELFRVEVIPFPEKSPIDTPLLVVDKFVGSSSPKIVVFPETTPIPEYTVIGNEVPMRRSRMHSAKTFIVSEPRSAEITSKESMVAENNTTTEGPSNLGTSTEDKAPAESLNVLQLSETTVKLSYCEVYSLCLDEFGREERACQAKAGRLMPGLPKRRRGACNRKLVPDYQAVDVETKNLDEAYGNCIKSRLGQSITEVAPGQCAAYSLPDSLPTESCHSRLHVLRHHCTRLSKCCSYAKTCRDQVDNSDAARYLRRRKESLALASAKCQIHSYKAYRWKRKRLPETSSQTVQQ